jgi:putative membrane protein
MPVHSASLRFHLVALALVGLVLAWSGIAPKDRFTWLLEVVPGPIAAAILAYCYPRWRFTPLVVALIAIHAMILMVGGKYTYAEVPLFNWLRDEFGLARNYYDRVGHFAQGFVPAMVAREILIRLYVLPRGRWLFFLICCIALSISAVYEFIEWWVAIASGEAAESFLGTQGDVWDTQWDMFMALVGAATGLVVLSRWHDKQLGLAIGPRGAVSLREITQENIDAVGDLRVAQGQIFHVAGVAKTLWQACGRSDRWVRAIYADEEPVGLVALVDPSLAGRNEPELYFWRLLVDARQQGRGYGRKAIALALEYARSRPGAERIKISYVPSNKAVGRLYEEFGFRHTGAADEDGELEMILPLNTGEARA